MALVSTTTVASSSSYHCDPLFPAIAPRSWCRPRSRGGGGGRPRLSALSARLSAPPSDSASSAPATAGERDRYSYEVDSLIDRLSNLAPRGSIAKCLETARHRLTLQ